MKIGNSVDWYVEIVDGAKCFRVNSGGVYSDFGAEFVIGYG